MNLFLVIDDCEMSGQQHIGIKHVLYDLHL